MILRLKDLHRPLSTDETEILTTRHERTLSSNLTLHYDRMVLILEPNAASRLLAGKGVMIVNYPDGQFAARPRQVARRLRKPKSSNRTSRSWTSPCQN